MKLFTIGNSFAVNSCKYLSEIFENGGVEYKLGRANLGGCSLETHWNNANGDAATYGDVFGGEKSLKVLLQSDQWDVVTIQQASHFSWLNGTFYPYADNLIDFIRKYAPQAEIRVHETWAYRADNERLNSEFRITQEQMFALLKDNYTRLAKKYGFKILPVGEAFRLVQLMCGDAIGETTRNPDGPSHANPYGEYIGGLLFYTALTGNSLDNITYIPEGITVEQSVIAKCAVRQALSMY